MPDTIAAVATPPGVGGIGIVRLSGEKSLSVVQALFVPAGGKKTKELANYALTLGKIIDPETLEPVDQVLLAVMRSPRSYTGEDVCEIHCHGGRFLTRRILEMCLTNGARPALPGEFTKRAFLNGKMDLTQAEGVVDLINSGAASAARAAMGQAEGRVGKKVAQIRGDLLALLSFILAGIEYPEETDLAYPPDKKVMDGLSAAFSQLKKLCDTFEQGRILKEGVSTVIIGRPNVGKSSLLNLLAGEERAIVTELPGTTRDVVTEQIQLGNVTLNISDTAGIRESRDKIEKIGVERSLSLLERSELILYVLDSSAPLSKEDLGLMEKIRDRKVIVLVNKTDLPQRLKLAPVREVFSRIVPISAATGEGQKELARTIEELFSLTPAELQGGEILANLRQKECVRRGMESLQRGMEGLKGGFGPDIVSIDIQEAIEALGELTGQQASEDMISEVFSRFCLGK